MNFDDKNYKLVEKIFDKNLDLDIYTFIHVKTNQKHVHLQPLKPFNDEKCAMISFNTIPQDSTGVAHILEHSVLCGSEKYPVKDVFFSMTKRTLATFMNAMTGSDATMYPFSSANDKDFKNLLDIYLDSVFHSRIEKYDFLQEGWRYGFKDDDENSDLIYKGVVYNEMKGVMQNSVSRIYKDLKSNLYKNSTYKFDSGGDPADIPNLSYEKLKEFYNVFYHPSNSTVFSFGDIDLVNFHAQINDSIKNFSKLDVIDSINEVLGGRQYFSNEEGLEKPGYVTNEKDHIVYGRYQKNVEEDKNNAIISYLTIDSTNLMDEYRLSIVYQYLFGSAGSPMRQAFENTKLGQMNAFNGPIHSNKTGMFMFGLSGVESGREGDVYQLIDETLKKISQTGDNLDMLNSIINDMELSSRERRGDGQPYGLKLCLAIQPYVLNNVAISDVIDSNFFFNSLREEIKKGDFIKNLVSKFFLNNSAKIQYVAVPDDNFTKEIENCERDKLEKIKANLTTDQINQIINDEKVLKEKQNSKSNLDVLPEITLKDVDLKIKSVCSKFNNLNSNKKDQLIIEQFDVDTGIHYFNLNFKIPKLDKKELQYLSIYKKILFKVGFNQLNYLEADDLRSQHLGFLSEHLNLNKKIDGKFIFDLNLSGKMLSRNISNAYQLLIDNLSNPDFDDIERIRFLIKDQHTSVMQNLKNSGNSLLKEVSNKEFDRGTQVAAYLNGAKFVGTLKYLNDNIEKKEVIQNFITNLKNIHKKVLNNASRYMVIDNTENFNKTLNIVGNKLMVSQNNEIENNSFDFKKFSEKKLEQNVLNVLYTDLEVNNNEIKFKTCNQLHPDYPALRVLGQYLEDNYLHREIREMGGAYGTNATNTNDGDFIINSMRDPNSYSTIQKFLEGVLYISNTNTKDGLVLSQMENAKLSLVRDSMEVTDPVGECFSQHHRNLHGITIAERENNRRNIIEVTVDDMVHVNNKYLKNANYIATSYCNDKELGHFIKNGYNVASLENFIQQITKMEEESDKPQDIAARECMKNQDDIENDSNINLDMKTKLKNGIIKNPGAAISNIKVKNGRTLN